LFPIVVVVVARTQTSGGLTGKEWQDPELKQRYKEHWVPYILELIQAQDQSSSTSSSA
jgi:hypothetical protein